MVKCFANRYVPRDVLPLCLIFGHFEDVKWLTTAQTPTVTAVSGVRITTLLSRTRNLTTIACGRWSLVTIQGEVARRSFRAF